MTLRAPLICALMILGACSDPPGLEPEPARPLSAALVSSAIVRPTAALGGQAYVSMLPGTDMDGRRVDVRNLRNGALATSPMTSGGFDPVAVEAEAGDTLSVTVVHQAGDDTTTYSIVPIKSRPRVVRTSPAMGKTDVPLNSLILVVFNEPMDSASLPAALNLQQNGADVPGSVSGQATGGVILSGRFVPASPLAPLSTYELSVSTAAQSPDGAPLYAPLTVQFTTTALAGPARLRVVNAEPKVGNMDFLIDGTVVVSDLAYLTATDYMNLASGSHEMWTQVFAGTMAEYHTSFTAGADYTVIPCCALMQNGNLLRADNDQPPVGQASIRFVDYATVASSVRIYLTSPGADLATAVPIPVDITWATDYFEVPAGDYQIRITPFNSDVVAMDSGPLSLLAGQVRTVIAVDAPGGGEPHDFLILEDLN